MLHVSSDYARSYLRELLNRVIGGETIVIDRYRTPEAVLVPIVTWEQLHEELARLRRIVQADADFQAMREGDNGEDI